jgi:uncharacterized ParB-like nuclease family protein
MDRIKQAELKLSEIQISRNVRVCEGTQQRDIDEATLSEYTELISGGVQFPPVEVVHEGRRYFLWDGFHRYFAHRDAGKTTILANVRIGTLRDAVWLSFGANKGHGLRRKPEDVRNIIAQIHGSPKMRNETTTKKIAEHVGVSLSTVERVFSELDGKGPKTRQRSGIGQAESDTFTGEPGPDNAPCCRELDRKEIKGRDPEPLMDSAGNEVPKHLAEIFLARSWFMKQADAIRGMVAEINHRIEDQDKLLGLFNVQRFNEHTRNLIETFKFATPYAVCPYCGGDAANCKACHGLGFMSKMAYEAAPRELTSKGA